MNYFRDDEFMVIACDGIWNVLTSEEAVSFVREHLQEATPEETSCKTFLSDIASKVHYSLIGVVH